MPNDAASGQRDGHAAGTIVAPTPADVSAAALPGDVLQQHFDKLREPLPDVTQVQLAAGEAAWISLKSPAKPGPNEDAVAVIRVPPDGALLLVADGLGGHRGGRRASQLMRSQLVKAARKMSEPRPTSPVVISGVISVPSNAPEVPWSARDHRSSILDEIEKVNQRLLRARVGAATTLALLELRGTRVRTYHVGDSEILIVSQRGRLKYSTVSHSPVGYAVESGMLTEEEALLHPDRHLVSNVVGSDQMSVELGPWVALSPRDTVLLASDGLFDNLLQWEIIELIRKGKLADGVRNLAELARSRMVFPSPEYPSKPDDLSILAYRGTRSNGC